jgi:prepilin-type N-terminal cleavage/methylation domain-containing protein
MYSRVGTRNGFTIVELLIVVVVIAILAAITIVAYNGIQNRAKISAVKSSLESAVKSVEVYAIKNGDMYPVDAAAAGLKSSSGTSYEVSSNNTANPKSYCVTASLNGLSYFQTSAFKEAIPGTCVGLLAWWPLNGSAQDMSGNNVDGSVVGASVVAGQANKPNGAYRFTANGQYIGFGMPTSFSTVPSAFTYSIWAAYEGNSTSQWPVIMGSNNTHTYFGIRGASYGDRFYFEWGDSPYNGSSWSGTGSAWGDLQPTGSWHHFAVTYDGSVLTTYFDGNTKSTGTSISLNPLMADFYIGNGGAAFIGKVDDARVYNRALSASDIETLYSAGAQ